MDPLEAFRSAIAKKRSLERKDGNIIIGQHVFPDKTYTCMKKLSAYETHKSVKETSFYTLDSIFFFWTTLSTNSSMDQGSYAILCADNNVDAISFAQRGALLNYLNGKEKSCIYFDTSVPFRYVKPQFASSLTSGTEEKKETADAAQVVNSIQYYKRMRSILGNEKIYETRSKVINLNGKTKFKEAVLVAMRVNCRSDLFVARWWLLCLTMARIGRTE